MCHAVLLVRDTRLIEAVAIPSEANANATAMIDDCMLDAIGTLVR